jgi:hypothetical protein
MPQKFVCKFEIIPPNDKTFKVPKRIIGPKGVNMKNIVQTCKQMFGTSSSKHVKIRLRGKESGYLEGPFQKES